MMTDWGEAWWHGLDSWNIGGERLTLLGDGGGLFLILYVKPNYE